jgi:DNA/RNA-binding domain of Phe-tRNA-synthetase-like protein
MGNPAKMIENNLSTSVKLIEIPFRLSENTQSDADIRRAITQLSEDLKRQYGQPAEALDRMQPARSIYKNLGIDPTRYRPSSEALLRRAIQAKPMPAINAAVDGANFISMKYMRPLGLYDTSKIKGPIRLRTGKTGEWYEGLGKPRVHLDGKYVLSDAIGPFGNPSSDSKRTSISLASRHFLMVVFVELAYTSAKENDIRSSLKSVYHNLGYQSESL